MYSDTYNGDWVCLRRLWNCFESYLENERQEVSEERVQTYFSVEEVEEKKKLKIAKL